MYHLALEMYHSQKAALNTRKTKQPSAQQEKTSRLEGRGYSVKVTRRQIIFFQLIVKHVPYFVNMLVIFDVHIKVCAGNKGICVTVADCCCTKGICGKDDCCLNSNDVEVKCVDVYYHKQKIVKRECREYGRDDQEPTTTTTKATPTVDDGNNTRGVEKQMNFEL